MRAAEAPGGDDLRTVRSERQDAKAPRVVCLGGAVLGTSASWRSLLLSGRQFLSDESQDGVGGQRGLEGFKLPELCGRQKAVRCNVPRGTCQLHPCQVVPRGTFAKNRPLPPISYVPFQPSLRLGQLHAQPSHDFIKLVQVHVVDYQASLGVCLRPQRHPHPQMAGDRLLQIAEMCCRRRLGRLCRGGEPRDCTIVSRFRTDSPCSTTSFPSRSCSRTSLTPARTLA